MDSNSSEDSVDLEPTMDQEDEFWRVVEQGEHQKAPCLGLTLEELNERFLVERFCSDLSSGIDKEAVLSVHLKTFHRKWAVDTRMDTQLETDENMQLMTTLLKCVEVHNKNAVAYQRVYGDIESLKLQLSEALECIDINWEDVGEDTIIEEANEVQELLRDTLATYTGWWPRLDKLKEKCANIVPVHKRTTGDIGNRPAASICDYIGEDISLHNREAIIVVDNTDENDWVVINGKGKRGNVPSSCCLIPPPDKKALEKANRLTQKLLTHWRATTARIRRLVQVWRTQTSRTESKQLRHIKRTYMKLQQELHRCHDLVSQSHDRDSPISITALSYRRRSSSALSSEAELTSSSEATNPRRRADPLGVFSSSEDYSLHSFHRDSCGSLSDSTMIEDSDSTVYSRQIRVTSTSDVTSDDLDRASQAPRRRRLRRERDSKNDGHGSMDQFITVEKIDRNSITYGNGQPRDLKVVKNGRSAEPTLTEHERFIEAQRRFSSCSIDSDVPGLTTSSSVVTSDICSSQTATPSGSDSDTLSEGQNQPTFSRSKKVIKSQAMTKVIQTGNTARQRRRFMEDLDKSGQVTEKVRRRDIRSKSVGDVENNGTRALHQNGVHSGSSKRVPSATFKASDANTVAQPRNSRDIQSSDSPSESDSSRRTSSRVPKKDAKTAEHNRVANKPVQRQISTKVMSSSDSDIQTITVKPKIIEPKVASRVVISDKPSQVPRKVVQTSPALIANGTDRILPVINGKPAELTSEINSAVTSSTKDRRHRRRIRSTSTSSDSVSDEIVEVVCVSAKVIPVASSGTSSHDKPGSDFQGTSQSMVHQTQQIFPSASHVVNGGEMPPEISTSRCEGTLESAPGELTTAECSPSSVSHEVRPPPTVSSDNIDSIGIGRIRVYPPESPVVERGRDMPVLQANVQESLVTPPNGGNWNNESMNCVVTCEKPCVPPKPKLPKTVNSKKDLQQEALPLVSKMTIPVGEVKVPKVATRVSSGSKSLHSPQEQSRTAGQTAEETSPPEHSQNTALVSEMIIPVGEVRVPKPATVHSPLEAQSGENVASPDLQNATMVTEMTIPVVEGKAKRIAKEATHVSTESEISCSQQETTTGSIASEVAKTLPGSDLPKTNLVSEMKIPVGEVRFPKSTTAEIHSPSRPGSCSQEASVLPQMTIPVGELKVPTTAKGETHLSPSPKASAEQQDTERMSEITQQVEELVSKVASDGTDSLSNDPKLNDVEDNDHGFHTAPKPKRSAPSQAEERKAVSKTASISLVRPHTSKTNRKIVRRSSVEKIDNDKTRNDKNNAAKSPKAHEPSIANEVEYNRTHVPKIMGVRPARIVQRRVTIASFSDSAPPKVDIPRRMSVAEVDNAFANLVDFNAEAVPDNIEDYSHPSSKEKLEVVEVSDKAMPIMVEVGHGDKESIPDIDKSSAHLKRRERDTKDTQEVDSDAKHRKAGLPAADVMQEALPKKTTVSLELHVEKAVTTYKNVEELLEASNVERVASIKSKFEPSGDGGSNWTKVGSNWTKVGSKWTKVKAMSSLMSQLTANKDDADEHEQKVIATKEKIMDKHEHRTEPGRRTYGMSEVIVRAKVGEDLVERHAVHLEEEGQEITKLGPDNKDRMVQEAANDFVEVLQQHQDTQAFGDEKDGSLKSSQNEVRHHEDNNIDDEEDRNIEVVYLHKEESDAVQRNVIQMNNAETNGMVNDAGKNWNKVKGMKPLISLLQKDISNVALGCESTTDEGRNDTEQFVETKVMPKEVMSDDLNCENCEVIVKQAFGSDTVERTVIHLQDKDNKVVVQGGDLGGSRPGKSSWAKVKAMKEFISLLQQEQQSDEEIVQVENQDDLLREEFSESLECDSEEDWEEPDDDMLEDICMETFVEKGGVDEDTESESLDTDSQSSPRGLQGILHEIEEFTAPRVESKQESVCDGGPGTSSPTDAGWGGEIPRARDAEVERVLGSKDSSYEQGGLKLRADEGIMSSESKGTVKNGEGEQCLAGNEIKLLEEGEPQSKDMNSIHEGTSLNSEIPTETELEKGPLNRGIVSTYSEDDTKSNITGVTFMRKREIRYRRTQSQDAETTPEAKDETSPEPFVPILMSMEQEDPGSTESETLEEKPRDRGRSRRVLPVRKRIPRSKNAMLGIETQDDMEDIGANAVLNLGEISDVKNGQIGAYDNTHNVMYNRHRNDQVHSAFQLNQSPSMRDPQEPDVVYDQVMTSPDIDLALSAVTTQDLDIVMSLGADSRVENTAVVEHQKQADMNRTEISSPVSENGSVKSGEDFETQKHDTTPPSPLDVSGFENGVCETQSNDDSSSDNQSWNELSSEINTESASHTHVDNYSPFVSDISPYPGGARPKTRLGAGPSSEPPSTPDRISMSTFTQMSPSEKARAMILMHEKERYDGLNKITPGIKMSAAERAKQMIAQHELKKVDADSNFRPRSKSLDRSVILGKVRGESSENALEAPDDTQYRSLETRGRHAKRRTSSESRDSGHVFEQDVTSYDVNPDPDRPTSLVTDIEPYRTKSLDRSGLQNSEFRLAPVGSEELTNGFDVGGVFGQESQRTISGRGFGDGGALLSRTLSLDGSRFLGSFSTSEPQGYLARYAPDRSSLDNVSNAKSSVTSLRSRSYSSSQIDSDPSPQTVEFCDSSIMTVDEFSNKHRIDSVVDPWGMTLSVAEAVQNGIIDMEQGKYVNPITGSAMSIDSAICKKLITQRKFSLEDFRRQRTEKLESRQRSSTFGSTSPTRSSSPPISPPTYRRSISASLPPSPPRTPTSPTRSPASTLPRRTPAHRPSSAVTNAYGLIHVNSHSSAVPCVIKSVANTLIGKSTSFDVAKRCGIVNINNQTFLDKKYGRMLTFDEAIEEGLMELDNEAYDVMTGSQLRERRESFLIYGVMDQAQGRRISLKDAFAQGIIDKEQGTYLDTATNVTLPIFEAITNECLKAKRLDGNSLTLYSNMVEQSSVLELDREEYARSYVGSTPGEFSNSGQIALSPGQLNMTI